nr:TfoX/Sxy family protein [Cronobacter sakazakii]
MNVSREYVTFVLDQLAPLGAVETRRMFGCVALFQAGRMFALVDG